MKEWRNIPGFDGAYQVSDCGEIRSTDRMVSMIMKGKSCQSFRPGHTIIPSKTKCGYLDVVLYKDGKGHHCLVHRIVAAVFIPNPMGLPQVNHIDENKENNAASNLEWCTAKENSSWGTRPQRLQTKVGKYNMFGELLDEFDSVRDAAKDAGCDYTTIVHCCQGKQQMARGYVWRYLH